MLNMPMSPTINASYASRKKDGRTVMTKALSSYYKSSDEWFGLQNSHRHQAHRQVKSWLENGFQIGVVAIFQFTQGKVFTKDGRPQILDQTNRIKSLHDSVAKNLWIDDKEFFQETSLKTIGKRNQIDIVLSPEKHTDFSNLDDQAKVRMYLADSYY